jgi:hypothetical protein
MPSASAQAIVYYTRLNLAEARKTRNDPGAAVGYYLEAADWALQLMDSSSSNDRSEAQSIYDSACQEVTVLLHSTGERWNMPQTVPIGNITYRLRFATESRKDGTWDPSYFDFFRTPNESMKRSLTRRAGLMIGTGRWWEFTSPRTPGNIFCRGLASLALSRPFSSSDHRERAPLERVKLLSYYMIQRGEA